MAAPPSPRIFLIWYEVLGGKHSSCSSLSNTPRTVEILGLGTQTCQSFYDRNNDRSINDPEIHKQERSIQVTNLLREWGYGEYEGKTMTDIQRLRMQQGLDQHGKCGISGRMDVPVESMYTVLRVRFFIFLAQNTVLDCEMSLARCDVR